MIADNDFGNTASHGPRNRPPSGGAPRRPAKSGFALDPWVLAEGLARRWYWLILAAGVVAAASFFYTRHILRNAYTASVQLIRFETPNSTEFYKPRLLTDQTFASLLKSPELLQRVAKKAQPALTPASLASRLVVSPVRESDVVVVMVAGMDLKQTVALANLYGDEAGQFTADLQRKEALEANHVLTNQLVRMDAELETFNKKIALAPVTTGAQPTTRYAQLRKRLQDTIDQLDVLQSKYLDAHPLVLQKLEEKKLIEKQLAEETKASAGPTSPAGRVDDPEILRQSVQLLQTTRSGLAARQREAQMYIDNPPGYCKIFSPATEKETVVKHTEPKVIFMTVAGGLAGFFAALCLCLLVEILDTRLKTPRDVSRVTELPVLATLSNLNNMTPSEQRNWAFKTWTAIQGKLSSSPNHGLVCGVTSAGTKEGRSTWVNMLAQAASECGFRVLTVATLPPNSPHLADYAGSPHANNNHGSANGKAHRTPPAADVDGHNHSNHAANGNALAPSVLSDPMEVTQQLTGDDPQPMVHIPLPGWVWNLERRKQWQSALQEWRQIENIVILVELPPASEPEAVLLAQNLPNLIWLSDTGVVHAGPTREHLQTLRDARCNLVGSVVNHAPKAAVKDRFSRWTSSLALLLIAGGTLSAAEPQPQAQAQQPPPPRTITVTPVAPQAQPTPAIATNLAFSAYNSQQRAGWQQRFTLGPGDILNFALFGQPEFARTEVPIGPDGRISYLQAQDIMAAGLTIDELRGKLDQELGKFYRTPRTIITPVAYNSKKYFVLGKVVTAGSYSLDHPTSIVEAVARAHGLQTGILDSQNTIDIVDLQKSFLARGGKRIPVDLEKLFQHGDLSQNVALEPNDYLFFAAGVLKEVYVLGEIRLAGPVVHTENLTVVGAISSRGGFTDRAYKSRVLVVRGSLTAPQTFVVDTLATVDARGLDFRLQPKDIIYISWRPFIKAEELLDLAATAFIQSAIASWSGQNIGPFITSPILPSL